jgi:hypothetical protein
MACRMRAGLCSVAVALTITGCARFPEVDAAEPVRTEPVTPPSIAPIEPIIERADAIDVTSDTAKEIEERGAALRRRADALKARTD